MPSSRCNHVPTVVSIIRQYDPSSILDIGVGFGKWGHLFREYTDIIKSEIDPPRYERANWKVTIDGIEGFKDYLTPAHAYFYNNIFIGDMREKIREVGRYDVIFLGDVIEHVNKEDGYKLLNECLAHANKGVVVTTPGLEIDQGAICSNELEIHRSFWEARDFNRFPLHATGMVEDGDILIGVLGKPGVPLPAIRPPIPPTQKNHRPPPTMIAHLKRPLRPLKPVLRRIGLLPPTDVP